MHRPWCATVECCHDHTISFWKWHRTLLWNTETPQWSYLFRTVCGLWWIVNIFSWWPETIADKELWRNTDQESMLDQIRRRKRYWLDTHTKKKWWYIAKRALEWILQGHRWRQRTHEERSREGSVERFQAQWKEDRDDSKDTAGWRQVWVTRHESSKSLVDFNFSWLELISVFDYWKQAAEC